MVLCQFYLNNNCRFGSKCVNEHFDVKQLIKTEVEAAIKGTQWPLSCFSPFKEKPCLPNFITDQSFEEVRCMFYEAKKQNNLQSYAQQFTQEVMTAQNRMKALLSLNRDVIEAVVNLYNSQDSNANQQGQKSNPFSLSGGTGFGQPQAVNTNTNSIFGGSSVAQANPFVHSGFGGVAPSTTSIFGGTATATVANNSLFSQQAGYGANTFGAPNASVFGGGQQQQQPQLNSFALPQLGANQQSNQVSSPFGMSAQMNSFASQTGSPFPTQNTVPPIGLFGQQNNQMQTTGIFGQANGQQQQQTQPQTAAFTTPAMQQSAGMFGQQSNSPAQSIFGGSLANATQQQPPYGSQIQMQQQQHQSPVGFGVQQTGIFGTSQQNLQQQQQQQTSAATVGNFRVGGQTGVFQHNFPQSFGAQNNTGQAASDNSNISDLAYSRMEDLTPELLEAFRAPEFVLGKMPTVPPPRELC